VTKSPVDQTALRGKILIHMDGNRANQVLDPSTAQPSFVAKFINSVAYKMVRCRTQGAFQLLAFT
jgi:hypothetical protein